MSDIEGGRPPFNHKMNDHGHSPHNHRNESPRNHKRSFSRSASRSRKYRDGDRERHERKHRSRSRSRSAKRYKSRRYSRSHSKSPGYEHRSFSRSPMSSRRRHTGTRDNPQPCRCVGVFGLSMYTTENELYHIFNKYGTLERVQVVIDAKTARSRGFAFVYFEDVDAAKTAKEQCCGMKIDGKNIRVDYSITQRAHTPTPGIYMGKPTSRYSRYSRYEKDDYHKSSKYSSRHSPSPYYRGSRRYGRSRSRSYSNRRY